MMMRNNGVGGPIWAIATMVGYGSILRCFDVASRRGRLYEVYTAVFLKVPYYWGRISNNPSAMMKDLDMSACTTCLGLSA